MAKIDELLERSRKISVQKYYEFIFELTESSEILKKIQPNKRRLWLADVIQEIYKEKRGLCGICGKPVVFGEHQVDHKIPFSKGGGNESGNIQISHQNCNNKKSAQVDPWDLLRYLEDKYMNR